MNINGNTVGHPLPDPRKGMTMSGPINMNGNRIEGIGNPVDDQDAVPLKVANDLIGTAVGTAKNELSRKLCVPNLLDNSDFTNPVNQRGYVSGTMGAANYTIDRWKLQYDTYLHLHSGYVGISGFWSLTQPVGCKMFAGKTYTFSVEAKSEADNGNMFIRLGDPTGTGAREHRQAVNSNSWSKCVTTWTADRDYEPGECDFGFGINAGDKLTTQIYYRNPAIYEGEYTAETLPEYQPKGYANELLACNVADSGNVSGMKLLWENASPESAFAGQTITLGDISAYKFFAISTKDGGTYFVENVVGYATRFTFSAAYSNSFEGHTRNVAIIKNGLEFANEAYALIHSGTCTTVEANAFLLPLAIYGIKGVFA